MHAYNFLFFIKHAIYMMIPNKIYGTEEIQVNGKNEFEFRFTETDSENRPVFKESCLTNVNEDQHNS